MNYSKYLRRDIFTYANRSWPNRRVEKPPVWCSVDLRDGNQALRVPMELSQKIAFFKMLCDIGFKEIEIGFPAASDTEYLFTRALIEGGLIPDGVVIQVLTQIRNDCLEKTFAALDGAKNKAIVHIYNSVSALQRKVVFKKSRQEVKELACLGAEKVLEYAGSERERFIFEYSPESFTQTEPDYALEVVNAVLDIWRPSRSQKAIINLPSTVETQPPNEFADLVEYMCDNIRFRENVTVSLHTHNDRGCAIAAAEMGLLAGADRVEGTLFGNGERTGNCDIVTLALNLYAHGVDTGLNLSRMDELVETYEKFTLMSVPERQPYAGELVFTAFSGGHQDAIKKGLSAQGENCDTWEVPYLAIDPKDIGRDIETVIRINSQSGKGGVAYVMEKKYGVFMPEDMQKEFSRLIKKESDETHRELRPDEIYALFEQAYVNIASPYELLKYNEKTNGISFVEADIKTKDGVATVSGEGEGLLDAFCQALKAAFGVSFEIVRYSEHSLEYGLKSRAITYVHFKDGDGRACFGAGVSQSVSRSSLRAIVSAVNRMVK